MWRALKFFFNKEQEDEKKAYAKEMAALQEMVQGQGQPEAFAEAWHEAAEAVSGKTLANKEDGPYYCVQERQDKKTDTVSFCSTESAQEWDTAAEANTSGAQAPKQSGEPVLNISS